MILLDTNVVSELYRPRPDATVMTWLDTQRSDLLFLCAPVLAELWFGVELLPAGRRKASLFTAIERLQNEVYVGRILPFDVSCVTAYGRLVALRRKSGRSMQQMDAFIAAVAAANGAALATRNIDHFEGLGLDLINPFDATAARQA